MVIDLSEIGLIGLLSNFFILTLGLIMVIDLYHFVKKKERKTSLVVFSCLFTVSLIAGFATGFVGLDFYSLMISLFYLISLAIGVKFKKIVSVVWIVIILVFVGFLISFFSYLITGEEGKVIATLKIEKKNQQEVEALLLYKNKEKKISLKADMLGFEAFQMVLKPYMSFFFGKKKFLLTNVFSEVFKEEGLKGETAYTPLTETVFDRRTLWLDFEKKRVLLIGVQGVQRTMVSVYPEDKATYDLKVTNQGLILVKHEN